MENKLGIIISKLRKEKGLTQKDLANELNISDKAVSRWETGSSSPNMEMLLRISKFFNIPFNDLITARVSSDGEDDNLVQEIIQEFTEMNKKNSKRIKTILLAAITIVLILTIAIIFTNSYNRFKVYKVQSESSDIYPIDGVYVETRIKDVLNIGDLEIKNLEIKETDTVSVDLYFKKDNKEYILQSYSSLENIYFVNYLSYIKINDLNDYMDCLYLKVTIIDEEGKSTEYIVKLNFTLDFSNNKIFYQEESSKIEKKISTVLSEEEIKDILLENRFEELKSKSFMKRTNKYVMSYIPSSNKISYNFEENNLSYRFTYQINNGVLCVVVFDENTIEIENYTYDTINEKIISCNVGNCKSYKYAMKILNENILKLIQ